MAPRGASCVGALWGDFRSTPVLTLNPHVMPTSGRHQLTCCRGGRRSTPGFPLSYRLLSGPREGRATCQESDTASLQPPARD